MSRAIFLLPGVVFLWLAGALATPLGAFNNNGDGTVTDPATGLMWDRCSWGQTWDAINDCAGGISILSWQGALQAAVTANADNYRGYSDWRVPNVKELESLVDISKMPATPDITAFPQAQNDEYWTSTTSAGAVPWYTVDFGDGAIIKSLQSEFVFLRLVRGGHDFDILAAPCGSGLPMNESEWAMLALPCVPAQPMTPANTMETGQAGGLTPGAYDVSWVLYERMASAAPAFYRRLLASDELQSGKGYWFFGQPGAFPEGFERLVVSGTGTPSDVPYGVSCASQQGCRAIPVTTPGGNRYNLVGNPFPYPIRWADVRIRVNGTQIYTPSQAAGTAASGNASPPVLDKQIWIWNGNTYVTFDDGAITDGDLEYFRAFWVNVLPGAEGQTIELLIPAGSASSEAPASAEEAVAASDGPWYGRWLDRLLPAAQASELRPGRGPEDISPPGWSRVPSAAGAGMGRWNATLEGMTAEYEAQGLSTEDAERRAQQKALDEGLQWYVRLKVADPATGRKDHNNVLGQLLNASDGYDPNDLVLLPPFASPYLTLVFPRPDWGVHAGDYASDFRSTEARTPLDWTFEIRAGPPGSAVVLRWEGDPEILKRSRLTDHATGQTVKATDRAYRFGYPVALTEGSRSFTWRYLGPTGKRR